MDKVRVHLKGRSYDIVIGRGLLKRLGPILKACAPGTDAIVITNKSLLKLYKKQLGNGLKSAGFTIRFETVPDSEKAKSAMVATRLIGRISAYDKKRQVFIVAFGGGVVGDLAGFIAAVYRRGIPYIQIPTTLLAQVDSAIGGKVALDLPIAKNMVGAFYQPRAVISDVSLLKSLPVRQIRNGLAEVVKYGMINDRKLFEFLEKNSQRIKACDEKSFIYIVARSSRIKSSIVSKDEFDVKGVRAVLNYGHTIGHAIEAASGYSGRYSHGESISIGMVAACRMALELGIMKYEDAARLESLLEKIGLPTKVRGLKFKNIYDSHLHDKKFLRKKNRFVLPCGIGRVKLVEGVPDSVVRRALREIFV